VVADVFDALTSTRPYKAAWELERAREHILQCSGSHFDPACVEAFLSEWESILIIRECYQDDVIGTKMVGVAA
jgi:putative two-component system response regulator